VRDITGRVEIPMTIGHYLNSMSKLTRQFTPDNFRDPKRQRLYLKDIDCPAPWHQFLEKILPRQVFYLNDSIVEKSAPSTFQELDLHDQILAGRAIGPAGDLMSSLPPEMRAENMMCYIGPEGTFTPAHQEMCATLGQNLMVETSSSVNGEQPGSSIWFMTETKYRPAVAEYFLSMLGHDIEVESHFAQINAWKKVKCPIYIVEQKVGDLILIPPLAPHQVWNRGLRTMKVAWNRTTVDTLELAMHEALPRARMVCRDEQYKCKAIIYYSLLRYYEQLKRVEQVQNACWDEIGREQIGNADGVKQLKRDFRKLFVLYTEVLVSEMFSENPPAAKDIEFIPFDSNITCSYCRCNIFNRFLTCKSCIQTYGDGEEDTYDICMECYAMGRSCHCLSNLTWVEQWQWSELVGRYEDWRMMVILNDGVISETSSPQPLEIERARYGKIPVAEICQEQLRRRPWKDITKPEDRQPTPESEGTPEVDDEGYVKRKKTTRRQSRGKKTRKQSATRNCHICKKQEPVWKLAQCSKCEISYCYGTLWRAFDLKPQTIMENPDWQCPKCQKMCSCGACARDPSQHAYRPKGTLLGHDTSRIADPRSVESLVDFSRANVFWLRDEDNDPQNSQRMRELLEKAQNEQVPEDVEDDDVLPNPDAEHFHGDSASHNAAYQLAIDPELDELFLDSSQPRGHVSGDENVGHGNSGGQALGASLPIRESGLGRGLYEQESGPDKILFEDPEDDSAEVPDSNVAYPKLLVQDPGPSRSTAKKDADPAHLQFYQAQKKQKLVEARKHGTYFMTLHQLEGGKPLIVKLALKQSKDFLRNLEELDKGRTKPRHNPRSPRSTQNVNEDYLQVGSDGAQSESDDTTLVRSDIPGKAIPAHANVDNDVNDGMSLAARAMKRLEAPPQSSKIGAGSGSAGPAKRGPGRPKKTETRTEDPDDEEFTAAAPTHSLENVTAGEGSGRGAHRSSTKVLQTFDGAFDSEDDDVESGNEVNWRTKQNGTSRYGRPRYSSSRYNVRRSPPSMGNETKPARRSIAGRASATRKSRSSQGVDRDIRDESELDEAPQGTTIDVVAAFNPVNGRQTPKERTPSPFADAYSDEDGFRLPEESVSPVSARSSVTSSHKPQPILPVDDDNMAAKDLAWREVQAELEAEKSAKKRVAAPAVKPASSKAILERHLSNTPAKQPHSVASPKSTPGKFMSMAERQALKGKTVKIVSKPASANNSTNTTPRKASVVEVVVSIPKVVVSVPANNIESRGTLRRRASSPVPAYSSPEESDSSCDSIPAVRPVSKKPRIEALSKQSREAKKLQTGLAGAGYHSSGRGRRTSRN
jgi:hypothetical protein